MSKKMITIALQSFDDEEVSLGLMESEQIIFISIQEEGGRMTTAHLTPFEAEQMSRILSDFVYLLEDKPVVANEDATRPLNLGAAFDEIFDEGSDG